MTAAAILSAALILVLAWALYATIRARHWRRSYAAALSVYASLPKASANSAPHVRAAQTRKQRWSAKRRAKAAALAAELEATS